MEHACFLTRRYSAEEGGLLGSQEVAQSYASKGVTVGAMLQQDSAFCRAPFLHAPLLINWR